MTAQEINERMLTDAVTTMETLNVCLGVRLGLYEALAGGPADSRQLAERAGIHPRYAREWLEQQGATGLLAVTDSNGSNGGTGATGEDAYARVFELPDETREVMLSVDSPFFAGTLPGFVASVAEVLTDVGTAFRTGGGVPYAAYGQDTRHGIGGLNRPAFLIGIADWVAALPDIEARLTAGPARVLDLGCGTGWSAIGIAETFGGVHVHGIDLDELSIKEAERNAAERGLADRVTFECGDAARPATTDRFDLVCVFEALHDMADPVAALRSARELLAPGGAVLTADGRVADHYTAPGDLFERLYYSFSVLHCLPATRAEGSAVEAGTVLRAETMRGYAAEAGYPACSELPIEYDLWRFYRLDAS